MAYNVFIKVPFPRGDFVDPPLADWTHAKESDLWKHLASASAQTEIDWDALAKRYDVTTPFLLQQAAWLYDRQMAQVREQFRRASIRPTTRPSSVLTAAPTEAPSTILTAQAMKRGGSQGSHGSRGGTAIPARGGKPFEPTSEAHAQPSSSRVPYSRSISTNTITQAPHLIKQKSPPRSPRPSFNAQTPPVRLSPRVPASHTFDDSDSSSEGETTMTRSRAFARRPQYTRPKQPVRSSLAPVASADEGDEEDGNDDDSDSEQPAFLPFASPTHDPSATLTHPHHQTQQQLAASITSLSSGQQSSPAVSTTDSPSGLRATIVSPRSNLHPRHRQVAREGSEGALSMGSSFSDLDGDTSLPQSALEEALAREMQGGRGSTLGVVSRVGGLWKGSGLSGGSGQGK